MQTSKPRLSISPKKGYVVKFSTVATEWLWGPQVPREWFWVQMSQGIFEGRSSLQNFFCIVEVPGSIAFSSGHPITCKINVRMFFRSTEDHTPFLDEGVDLQIVLLL